MFRFFCFLFGHWWSDWLVGFRRCWSCDKVQRFSDFKILSKKEVVAHLKNDGAEV